MQIRLRRFDSDLSLKTNMETFKIDCLVVGGGVSGVAIAQKLASLDQEVILIEKNNTLAQETSSRNSEVIHAGIYYKEGSLKSKLCVRGKELLYQYLEDHNLPYIKCGKFILATTEKEEKRLFEIFDNANRCGVNDLVINEETIKQYDFLNYRTSIFSPSTGIFDSHAFIESLKNEFLDNKGLLLLGNKLKEIDHRNGSFKVIVEDLNNSTEFVLDTKKVVNAGGLNAYEIFNDFNGEQKLNPLYKKGEYYSYTGNEKLNHLIYPIPGTYSLGIHATIDLGEGIRFGPSSYDVTDITYEVSIDQRKQFFESVKNYWPSIKIEELVPTYSGIRPLLQGFDDFVIDKQNVDESYLLSVLGYSSPGLTSSLALAEEVSHQIINF